MNGPLLHLAYAAALVLTRVSAFVAGCPALLPQAAPSRARNCGVIAIVAALTASLPALPEPEAPYLALLLEALCGIAMGLAVRITAGAVSYAGDILDNHAGFAFAQMVDPMAEAQVGPLQHLMHTGAGLLFFACNGQEQVIRGLAHSIGRTPPGALAWQPGTAAYLTGRVAEMFVIGLRLAAPLLGSLMVLQLGLALLTRVAPQLNIWGIGFGIICMAALAGLYVYAPAWGSAVAALWAESIGQMSRVWGAARG